MKVSKYVPMINPAMLSFKPEAQPMFDKACEKLHGYVAGEKIWKEKLVAFNPASRQQIYQRLRDKYGWIPQEKTEKGNDSINETEIQSLK